MFKYVLFLTLVVGCASPATISTSATCDGATTFGTTSARCKTSDAFADATAGPFGVSVFVETGIERRFQASASAYFSDTYDFTITGGNGQGMFEPCIQLHGYPPSYSVGMSFGSFGYSISGRSVPLFNTCDPGYGKMPFTFDVPQIIAVSASGRADNGDSDGSVQLTLIRFFDLSGNPLSNITYTLVSTTIPEPSSRTLLGVGLMFFLPVAIRRRIRIW